MNILGKCSQPPFLQPRYNRNSCLKCFITLCTSAIKSDEDLHESYKVLESSLKNLGYTFTFCKIFYGSKKTKKAVLVINDNKKNHEKMSWFPVKD